jgi:predicted metal-dependent phosphoesterase TrpH
VKPATLERKIANELLNTEMKFVDLHLHTTFSDGTYTPKELIAQAARKNLCAVAIVDHDTVDGIDPALETARGKGIEIIPGIELTAEYDNSEVHILGYLLDHKNNGLLQELARLKKNRVERVHKMADKLNDLGVKLDAESVLEIAKQGTVGRLHIARVMVKKGLVGSIPEAFRKYIGDKSPAYVCGFRFSVKEAIKLIKKAGGIPILAHPYSIDKDELIPEFVGYGLMGLEVYYPEHSQSMVNFYLGLAKKFNLLVTGGSDCHGDAKPEAKMGSMKVSYLLVEKLKQAKAELL